MRRSDLVLHLSEHHGDAAPGATIFVRMQGVVVVHRELSAKDCKYAKPGAEALPWGKVLDVADPFGNRLRFLQSAGRKAAGVRGRAHPARFCR